MAKKKEFSVEDKLRALYDLQLIDSRIDTIKSVRGELPLEVEDLEDEVAGLEVRIAKIHEELDQCTEDIKDKKNTTEHAKEMIKKYDLNDYIIIIIYKNNSNLRILSKLNINNSFKISNIKYKDLDIYND